MTKKMTVEASNFRIGIVGCGWLGMYIARHLTPNNKIYTTTTTEQKNTELISMGYDSIVMHFEDYEVYDNSYWRVLNTLDCIIITVPFSKRESITVIQNRFKNISSFINNFDKQLFLMSSIGIYPDIQMDISENSLTEDFLDPSILFAEQLFKNRFSQVNILRLGGLMGGSRVFSNYKITATNQVVNHVHFEDICLILEKMISENIKSKTYNVVAPLHPTKQEVIDYQKGKNQTSNIQGYGRKITSDLLQKELKYEYLHMDPRAF